VRKAVQAVTLTSADARLHVSLHDFRRELAIPGDTAIRETHSEREGASARPYVSPSPDSVATFGYALARDGQVTWFAPDAAILGSEGFVATHCFQLRAERADSGLVGVAFEPVRGRRVTDITGTAWLDAKTFELRSVDFQYTNLATAARERPFGGHVEFRRVSGGAWLIEAWRVSAPIVRLVERAGFSGGSMTSVRRVRDSVLVAALEEGGEVLVARAKDGQVAWASRIGGVHGVLRDSATGDAVRGATMELRGTTHRTVTDADGFFALTDVPFGEYVMSISVELPLTTPFVSTQPVTVGSKDRALSMNVAASRVARFFADSAARVAQRVCVGVRERREHEIDSTFAIPMGQWAPAGKDSAAIAEAVRNVPTILQAVGDTTGAVDMRTARALRHGPAATYSAAMAALASMEAKVEQPIAGCKVRRVILLPYRVTTDK
jgi:hypothetical protein